MKSFNIPCCLLILAFSASAARACETECSRSIEYKGPCAELKGSVSKFGTAGKAYLVVDVNGPRGGNASFNGNREVIRGNASGQFNASATSARGASASASGSTSISPTSGTASHTGNVAITTACGKSHGWSRNTTKTRNGFSSTINTQNHGSYSINASRDRDCGVIILEQL